jgi:hypothetical protein
MQKSLVPSIVGAAEGGKPAGAAAQDRRRDRDRFDVVDRGRAAIEADIGREWRLQARLALLALQAFQQRGLLAADIGAGAVMNENVKIPAVLVVLAQQSGVVAFVDRGLQRLALADELAAHIDVGDMRAHGETGDQAAFDQRMRIVAHDLAVLAGAGLGFVGVDDEIMRALAHFLRHEGPFETGRETGAAAAAQARILHLLDDPVAPLGDQPLRSVPMAAAHGALQRTVELAVDVGEDAVLVLKHHSAPLLSFRTGFGCARVRPCRLAGLAVPSGEGLPGWAASLRGFALPAGPIGLPWTSGDLMGAPPPDSPIRVRARPRLAFHRRLRQVGGGFLSACGRLDACRLLAILSGLLG